MSWNRILYINEKKIIKKLTASTLQKKTYLMVYLSERSYINTILHIFMQTERVIHGHITMDDIAITYGRAP